MTRELERILIAIDESPSANAAIAQGIRPILVVPEPVLEPALP